MSIKDLYYESFTTSAQRVYLERVAQKTSPTTVTSAFERLKQAVEEASKTFLR